jgi:hypothetical protein
MGHHTFVHVHRVLLAGALALTIPAAAAAQAMSASEWHHGTSLALFGGIASPGGDTRAAVGGSIGWELTPRLAIDAGGLWFDAGRRDDVVFGSVGVRYSVIGERRASPFVTAGVGLHRASLHTDNPGMPEFYRRRMGMTMGPHGMDGRRTFDDFASRFGGGAEFFAGRHVSFRPEVQVILVTDRRDTRVVPTFGVHLAYHFESHPITPSRR